MPAENSDPKFDLGHVLFIDIVGFSKLLLSEQAAVLDELNAIVRERDESGGEGNLVRLPTGDGMALIFRDTPESPARHALEIGRVLRGNPRLPVRMGIHSGPIKEIQDINGRVNFAGAGVNFAQRVMDCGDAGHILLSKGVADDLAPYGKWQPYLHDLGEFEVKHGVRIHIINLCHNEAGNSQLPAKLKAVTPEPQLPSPKRNFPGKLIAVLSLTALVVVGCFVLLSHFTPHSMSGGSVAATSTYPAKSYEGTKWSKIYGADRLIPARATLRAVSGWNRKNFAVMGTVENTKLLLLLREGEWKVERLKKTNQRDSIAACRYVDDKRLALLTGYQQGNNELVIWQADSYRQLKAVPAGTSLYALAADIFCGMDNRVTYWKYSGNKLETYEQTARESFVLKDENVVAQVKEGPASSSPPMLVANVRDVTTISDGAGLGLWSTLGGDCATVRYRDGRWYLIDRLAGFSARNVPSKVWFRDEKDFVAIGSDKVTRSVAGKVTLQAVLVGGQEYPAKDLVAVWGRDLNNYWTADRSGNVFHFDGTQWNLTVRGPDSSESEV